jgi:hypothetical protein
VGLKEDLMEKMMGSMLKEEREKMMQEAMEKMMAGMTQEDRRRMTGDMMERFFGRMSEAEKGIMMQSFMPEMMKTMMGVGSMTRPEKGSDKSGGMAEMMKMCMGSHEPPWITMQNIMEEVLKTSGFALVHTPELHALFSEFLQGKQRGVLSHLTEGMTLDDLAKKTGLCYESLVYLVLQLARRGELTITIEKK